MKLNNKYYILRHGEAVSNVKGICSSWPETFENPLTEAGVAKVKESAETLKTKSIDLVFSSDLLRARQTAEIAIAVCGAPVQFDERLREINFGSMNGQSKEKWDGGFLDEQLHLENRAFGGESYKEVLVRVTKFLQDIDSQYQGKNILIVSHQCPLWLLEDYVKEIPFRDDMKKNPEDKRISKGELRELN